MDTAGEDTALIALIKQRSPILPDSTRPLLLMRQATPAFTRPRRPALAHPKEHVNIRLDADVVGAFKGSGAGWQTRINNALREWLNAHPEIQKG